jgi:hypothetical protein
MIAGDRKGDRMDPVTLIVTALAAGAAGGALDAVKDDVKDAARAAYVKLRDLVKQRFQGNARAEVILAEHADDPQAYAAPLAKKLAESAVGDDAQIVAAARELMSLVDRAGAQSGKYHVLADHSQGVQIGDYSYMNNTFNE